MNFYLVTGAAKLYSFNRLIEATSKVEAAAQVDQTGLLMMWIEEVNNSED